MYKPTFTVKECLETHEFTRRIKTTIVTFMLFAVTSAGTASQVNYKTDRMAQPTVVKVVSGHSVTLNRVMPMTETMQMADTAFDKLTARMPDAKEAEPVMHFITEGIGSVDAERVTMDYDVGSKVLNVAYRLQGDMLLSVNKPLDTMDDEFVMFNMYHQRELLVSDSASIGLLAEYVVNVERRMAEEA